MVPISAENRTEFLLYDAPFTHLTLYAESPWNVTFHDEMCRPSLLF